MRRILSSLLLIKTNYEIEGIKVRSDAILDYLLAYFRLNVNPMINKINAPIINAIGGLPGVLTRTIIVA